MRHRSGKVAELVEPLLDGSTRGNERLRTLLRFSEPHHSRRMFELFLRGMREGWLTEAIYRLSFVGRLAAQTAAEAERKAEEGAVEIVSIAQAKELRPLFPSHTLLAVRGKASSLVREACTRVLGRHERVLYCVYVEEVPGLFLSNEVPDPNPDGVASLRHAFEEARKLGVELIPIWMISYNAAEAIARAVDELDVDGVIVGVSRRNALYRLLRGQVVKGLARRLPKTCHLILCN